MRNRKSPLRGIREKIEKDVDGVSQMESLSAEGDREVEVNTPQPRRTDQCQTDNAGDDIQKTLRNVLGMPVIGLCGLPAE